MKYLYIILCLLVGLSSCGDSFLEKLPQGNYVEETFYVSDEALMAATAVLYNKPWFEYNADPTLGISQLCNDCFAPWGDPQYNTFQVTGLDNKLAAMWKSFYSVITMANSVISACSEKASADCTEEGIKRAIAESRLMRATAYFYALRLWGPVILFEDNKEIVANPMRNRNKEEDVFQFIINDLTYAATYLPETWAKGRATCWAAKAQLAKAYLARSGWNGGSRNLEDLEKCKELCHDICTKSGLNLLPNYEDLFKYKFNNNEESLFAMQWVPLGDWGTQNALYSSLSFSDISGGVGAWGSPFPAIEMLELYEPTDTIRRNATFMTQNTYYPYLCIADGGYTYTKTSTNIKKGAIGGPDDDNDGYVAPMSSPLNTYIIRLADVYLTYAEACLGNNETLEAGPGLEYFNKVRERAKIAKKNSITFDDIMKERRIEFCMEYCNWYDMVNWYKWKPAKILNLLSNQQRGTRVDRTTKDEDSILHFEGYIYPTTEVEVTANKIFLPYPENDVIQNPLLKEEPIAYDFKE